MPARSSVVADPTLDALLSDYEANLAPVWDHRADGIFARWRGETGDFAAIAAALPSPLGAIVDLGVGYARTWPIYAHARRAVGVDVSTRMITLARANLPSDASMELVVASMESLPFSDGTFDVALAVRTLNHVPSASLAGALREVRRIARIFVAVEAREVRVDPRLEFPHDYPSALADAGFRVRERVSLEDADLYVAE